MNTLNELLVHPIFQRLGWTLVHSIWQGAAVAMLAAIALAMLGRRSSQTRYLVACGGLLVMLVALVVTFFILPGPILRPDIVAPMDQPVVRATGVMLAPRVIAPMLQSQPPLTLAEKLQQLLPVCAALWIIGIALISIRHVGGWARVQQLRKRAGPLSGEPWDALMSRLCERLGVNRVVAIAESALVQVPSVVGYFKPIILLPVCALSGLSPQQLEGLIAHELAHVRRHDYLVNLLQIVIETLIFYHPAAWWLSKRIRQERENCCDDLAANVCGNQIAYVQALAAMEELRMVPGELVLGARGGNLLPRVRRLLGVQTPRQRSWSLTAAIVVVIVALVPLIVAQHKAKADEAKPATQPSPQPTTSASSHSTKVLTTSIEQIQSSIAHENAQLQKTQDQIDELKRNNQTGTAQYTELNAKATKSATRVSELHAALTEVTRELDQLNKFAATVRPEDLVAEKTEYRIEPNDLVQVSIMDLTGAGQETVKQERVSDKGDIPLPYIGRVKAAGMTESELEKSIAKAYADNHLIAKPQVAVSITEAHGRTFSILGNVARAGQYVISQNDFRLLDALVTAGGLTDSPQVATIIRKDASEPDQTRYIQVPLKELTAANLKYNVVVHPKDMVIIGTDGKIPANAIEPKNATATPAVQSDQLAELVKKSRTAVNQGKYPEALAILDQILILDPNNEYATGVRPLLEDRIVSLQHSSTAPYSVTFPGLNESQPTPDLKVMLERKVPQVNFSATALGDVIDFLRDISNANIVVDWKSLEAAGLSKDSPVTTRVRDVSLAKALQLVLDSVSSDQTKVGYTVDKNVIQIGLKVGATPSNKPTTKESAIDPKTKATLDRELPEVNFEAVALGDAIDFLRDISGANLFVNWKSLEAAGLDKNTPVTLRVRNVSFGKVLDLLLQSAGGSDVKLAYTVDQGVISISAVPSAGWAAKTGTDDLAVQRNAALRAQLIQAERNLRELKADGLVDTNPNVVKAQKLIQGLERDLQLPTSAPTAPTSQPLYRAVRIVVGAEKMTLEGKETTWEKAKEELAKLPNRNDLVLEVAVASDQMTLAQHNEAVSKGILLASELKFKYLSDVGVHPLGSKGGQTPTEEKGLPPSTDRLKSSAPTTQTSAKALTVPTEAMGPASSLSTDMSCVPAFTLSRRGREFDC
jgi:protein involved in polysaccharide export with SLBB domain/beta-lactamase regulating signal transducer with metallopeptidase domain